MKIFNLILLILISLNLTARELPKRKVYINTPNGPVQVVTPQDYKNLDKQLKEKKEMKGYGQEFLTKVNIKEGKVTAWVRGCNWVTLGDTNNQEEDAKEEVKRLKELKNNQQVKIKMQGYGSCEVGGWSKN